MYFGGYLVDSLSLFLLPLFTLLQIRLMRVIIRVEVSEVLSYIRYTAMNP